MYPDWFINKQIKKTLSSITKNKPLNNKKEEENKHIFKFLYMGKASKQLKTSLTNIFKKYNVFEQLHIVFSIKRLSSNFSLKDQTPKMLTSCVVYRFTCSRDVSISYYGKTVRHMVSRIFEHAKKPSSVNDHLLVCTTCNRNNLTKNFEVISSHNSAFDVAVSEALLIKKDTPKLNRQLYEKGAQYTLKLFN